MGSRWCWVSQVKHTNSEHLIKYRRKTQAVLDYVYQFEGRISVFWIHAGTHIKFEQDYRKVAKLASIPTYDDSKVDIRPLVRDWLERPESGNWILVLDNADSLTDFFGRSTNNGDVDNALEKFIPQGSRGTVLVTTRDKVIASRLCDNHVLPWKAMNPDHAISLFRSHFPLQTESDVQLLDDLLKELSFLPLAIVQAASYLRENRRLITLSKYLERFRGTKQERLRLLSIPFADIRRNGSLETILTTFIISFEQIEDQSPLAGSLLRVMACINRQGMPIKLFQSMKRPDDGESVEEALGRLISFALVDSTQQTTVEMHALVHLSAQKYLSTQHKLRSAAETTAALLVDILPEGENHENRSVGDPASTVWICCINFWSG